MPVKKLEEACLPEEKKGPSSQVGSNLVFFRERSHQLITGGSLLNHNGDGYLEGLPASQRIRTRLRGIAGVIHQILRAWRLNQRAFGGTGDVHRVRARLESSINSLPATKKREEKRPTDHSRVIAFHFPTVLITQIQFKPLPRGEKDALSPVSQCNNVRSSGCVTGNLGTSR